MTAPSAAPSLGKSGRGRVPSVSSSASTTARSAVTGSSSALSTSPIKHRDWRALKQREPAYLLFQWGAPPNATYRFKHALVQDAAYGALLRERRRSLHALIVETLESQFAEIAEGQPALLARHCTEAGLLEKAASLWGKAGQRSLANSALVEAAEQLSRALAQIAALRATPALRRDQITLQVALANALMHVKGYAAPETKVAEERARLLIEQAQLLGEQHPMGLSILAGFWAANFIAFNGDTAHRVSRRHPGLRHGRGEPISSATASTSLRNSKSHLTAPLRRAYP